MTTHSSAKAVTAYTAVVTDLDRTLTDAALQPVPEALAALDRLRQAGIITVLATGRRWHELETQPALTAHFDHIVAEGGALLATRGDLRTAPGHRRLLRFAAWLDRIAIPYDPGRASLGLLATYEPMVAHQARRDGLRLQRNADRIDVTANEVDKGVAVRLLRSEGALGSGRVLAFADGENDVALAGAVDELIAVANAHPALLQVAARATRLAGGHGVADHLAECFPDAASTPRIDSVASEAGP